jgi:hypothetical protein
VSPGKDFLLMIRSVLCVERMKVFSAPPPGSLHVEPRIIGAFTAFHALSMRLLH